MNWRPTNWQPMNWPGRFSQHATRVIPSPIRALSKFPRAADTIPFGPGEPDAGAFPLDALRTAMREILGDDAAARTAFQYGESEGDLELRQRLCTHMAALGVRCGPANILITNGSQQALHLVSEALVDPGGTVAVQNPTYPGALQIFAAHGARLVDVSAAPPDTPPALIYAVANFQNPTGALMTASERAALCKRAETADSVLVEDDPYGALCFEGETPPPLLAFDTKDRTIDEARTVYLGTISKSVAPGLRIGWLAGPRPLIEKAAALKQNEDLQANSFAQAVLCRLLRDGLTPHLAPMIAAYRQRRDLMVEALQIDFGNRGSWEMPSGGFFVWVALSEAIDTTAMLKVAAQYGVTYVPGAAFTLDGSGAHMLRLSYSSAPPKRIREGVRRLARAHDACRGGGGSIT